MYTQPYYAKPRNKISHWLKAGELIRVKKGLYVFGKEVATAAYSEGILANLIYGPSVVSLSYALYYYGLIPERRNTITSITPKRNKLFSTPVGRFSYRYLHHKKFSVVNTFANIDDIQQFLIATQSASLCDAHNQLDPCLRRNDSGCNTGVTRKRTLVMRSLLSVNY